MGPKRNPGKPHECLFCGKSCPGYSALELHMNVHTLERPYMCTYCESSYASNSSLCVHTTSVHLGRKYICDICDKECNALANLLQHRKTHGEIARQKQRPKVNYVHHPEKLKLAPSTSSPSVIKKEVTGETSKTNLKKTPKPLPSQPSAAAPVKKFQCDICHKAFAHGFRLNAHRKLHGVVAVAGNRTSFRREPRKRAVLKWDTSFFLHLNRYVPET